MKYILVSESKIGIHKMIETKNTFSVYALTFPIRIVKQTDKDGNEKLLVASKLHANSKMIAMLKEASEAGEEVRFLIGFDLDEQGELMAEAVRDALLAAGIDEYDIFRTPLTEKGYLAMRRFSVLTGLKLHLYVQQKIARQLQKNGLPVLNIRSIFALKYLSKFKGTQRSLADKIVNIHGSSTVTAIQRHIISKSAAMQKGGAA